MALDGEVRFLGEGGELLGRNAHIDSDHAVAGDAGQVVVVGISADPIAMRSIGKLDAVQQTGVDQHFYRAVDGCTPQTWLAVTEILPEIVHGKVSPAVRQLDQAFGNGSAWACIAPTLLVKDGIDFLCNHRRAFLSSGR